MAGVEGIEGIEGGWTQGNVARDARALQVARHAVVPKVPRAWRWS